MAVDAILDKTSSDIITSNLNTVRVMMFYLRFTLLIADELVINSSTLVLRFCWKYSKVSFKRLFKQYCCHQVVVSTGVK